MMTDCNGAIHKIFRFEKYYQYYDSLNAISEIRYRMRERKILVSEVPDFAITHISIAVAEMVKNATANHTLHTGERASNIKFKLVSGGMLEVVNLPFMSADDLPSAILDCPPFYEDFKDFLLNQLFKFDLRFMIISLRSTTYCLRSK